MVGTVGTGNIHPLGVAEIRQGVKTDKAGTARRPIALRLQLPLGQQGRSDAAHFSGIGGPGDLTAQVLLQRPQHSVVFERTALHDHFVSQGSGAGDADDLGKDVFDDGTAKARHNVIGLTAVFLFRDDGAVHKHRAAAAQICRLPGAECRLRDLLRRDPQGGSKIFQK